MNAGITLADGQVAAAAAALGSNLSGAVNVTFANVGGQTETLVVTFLRNGGTSRRIARAVLAANEALVISGLPINAVDTLKAATTNATSVDYVVSSAPDSAPFSVASFDANGAIKQVNTGISGNQTASGALTSNGATSGVGYSTGAGGAITQLTSRSTGVTLNKVTGQITTNNASLAAAAFADFVVTNSAVAATDAVVASIVPGGTGSPVASVVNVAAGSFTVRVLNQHASTADTSADIVNYAVVKGVAA